MINYDTYNQVQNRLYGDVLIVGMGIGHVPRMAANHDNVNRVHIIEKKASTISLLYPFIKSEKTQLWEYYAKRPPNFGKMFDTIYLDTMLFTHEVTKPNSYWIDLYKPFLKENGWIGFWSYD